MSYWSFICPPSLHKIILFKLRVKFHKNTEMTPHLLGFAFLFITLAPQSLSNTSPFSEPFHQTVDRHDIDNETIFRTSKQLCWNCIGEALQFLFAHNLIRAAKWELPLAWDFELESYAKWWARERKSDCKLQHSFPENGFKLGENIFWGSGSGWTPIDAVNSWAEEEKYYTYWSNACESGRMCGHFTQIVWRKTRRVGCARVVCEDGDVFITCNYDPPGNDATDV